MRFSTKAIHVGEEPESMQHGDVVSPIHLSTTFAKRSIKEVEEGYVYSRSGNPTRDALERKLAALENAKYGLTFSSGLAAESTILLALLKKGDHVVAFDDLYGGTKRLFNQVMERFGIEFTYVDAREPGNVRRAIRENTRMVWLETPTNPLLKLADIRAVAEIAHERDIIVVVDNTFASPYFQNPLDLGADIVLHSVTKYLGGHSDVVGGAVMVNDDEIYERLKFHQNAVGAILSPFDSWLVMRGIKTLAVRMERHEKNAMTIAKYLEEHPLVERVYYPGLPSHPQHELAKRQMKGFSGMLSFELKGGLEEAVKFIESLEVFALAESLGGVESLIELPAIMTHASVPRDEREKVGIRDSLIRVSVGIEDVEDLIEDLERGFEAVRA
ncbi:cystathionine gamma-synthase [Thermococcus thioreducens]|uniref:Cystathionine gamma-lyase n=1 Tax=Thermococcus thioreducens TaxID=277988 RepID=A0A0Q2S4I1_9EURY|nr:cystathionine gamma-synthase [Thermococcus thioreducens]ASJ12646.1 cystathionine gamma-synthase [Thermococcus thioreducens]KQH82363.1 cystathionine gamma-synthase [Thermococcus thioreducens]SEV87326.1 cystathionine gamma-lyase [Thermococcus thioreducens]